MVREIVSIQVGQCGNKLGSSFWNMICHEQGISNDGSFDEMDDFLLEKAKVYFNETTEGKYIPRAILADFDQEGINNAKQTYYGYLYKPENIFLHQSDTISNWAAGFYSIGFEVIDSIIDIIRKEAESCDSLQGFQMIHSLSGGTGSGFGTLILNNLKDEYPEQNIFTFSVLSSEKVSGSFLDSYNTLLSLNELIKTAKQVFYFDNEEFMDIALKRLHLSSPTYGDLNYCISCDMSGATTSLRFPDLLNSDLRKMSFNLIPFPRFKFLKSTFAPTSSRGATRCFPYNEEQLKSILFDRNEERKKYASLSAYVNFHGNFHSSKVFEQMSIVNANSENEIKVSICPVRVDNHSRSATLVENSACVKKSLERQKSDFEPKYKRRAFVHRYLNEGLEMVEFDEANENLTDLIHEYEALETDDDDDENDNDE